MHYKNGREARYGDPVIVKDYNGNITAGVIHNLRAAQTCNCDVATLVPGGVTNLTCRTVGELYHAEDALKAIESAAPVPTTPNAA